MVSRSIIAQIYKKSVNKKSFLELHENQEADNRDIEHLYYRIPAL
jgi:hypothetical protein